MVSGILLIMTLLQFLDPFKKSPLPFLLCESKTLFRSLLNKQVFFFEHLSLIPTTSISLTTKITHLRLQGYSRPKSSDVFYILSVTRPSNLLKVGLGDNHR
jgi:hypothetical protein